MIAPQLRQRVKIKGDKAERIWRVIGLVPSMALGTHELTIYADLELESGESWVKLKRLENCDGLELLEPEQESNLDPQEREISLREARNIAIKAMEDADRMLAEDRASDRENESLLEPEKGGDPCQPQ